MNRGPYPHCPIAPGKGCQACIDATEATVGRIVSARLRRFAYAALVLGTLLLAIDRWAL